MSRVPSMFRQGDVTRAVKAVVAAGVDVARVEIDKTGKIVIVAGKSVSNTSGSLSEDANEWDKALSHDKR